MEQEVKKISGDKESIFKRFFLDRKYSSLRVVVVERKELPNNGMHRDVEAWPIFLKLAKLVKFRFDFFEFSRN